MTPTRIGTSFMQRVTVEHALRAGSCSRPPDVLPPQPSRTAGGVRLPAGTPASRDCTRNRSLHNPRPSKMMRQAAAVKLLTPAPHPGSGHHRSGRQASPHRNADDATNPIPQLLHPPDPAAASEDRASIGAGAKAVTGPSNPQDSLPLNGPGPGRVPNGAWGRWCL